MTATEWGWTQNDGKAPDTRAVTTARHDGPLCQGLNGDRTGEKFVPVQLSILYTRVSVTAVVKIPALFAKRHYNLCTNDLHLLFLTG